jgi:uncharacterized protein YjbI with pentapeptide repeats
MEKRLIRLEQSYRPLEMGAFFKRFLQFLSTNVSQPAAATTEKSERALDLEIQQKQEEIKKIQIETENLTLEQERLSGELGDIKRGWGWWFNLAKAFAGLSGLAGIVALFVSFANVLVTYHLDDEQKKKWDADTTLQEDRFVRETLEKVADNKAPQLSRIAFISDLNLHWFARQAPALGSVYIAIIRSDDQPQVQEACVQALTSAYEFAPAKEDKETVRRVLFGLAAKPRTSGASEVVDTGSSARAFGAVSRALRQELQGNNQAAARQLTSVLTSNRGNLQESDLSYMQFEKLDLGAGNLDGADLTSSNFAWSQFPGVSLRGAHLDEATFKGSSFARADLGGISATDVDFTDCDMSGCDLEGTRLENSTLKFVCFSGANLSEANFVGSTLVEADFTNAIGVNELGLSDTNIRGVKGLSEAEKARAFSHGAVEMSDADFSHWQANGFKTDASGKPQLNR